MKLNAVGAILAALALAACSGSGGGIFDGSGETGEAGISGDEGSIEQSALRDYEPDSAEYFANLIGNTIYFEVDRSHITEQSVQVLRHQAEWLSRNPNYTILVEGHADEQGTREYNLALGARRAAAVSAYLTDLGVLESRLKTVTYGKERPVSVCSFESCWSKNRRAVTVVEQELGG
ncbi:MAG: peptidoglycan-associated lipoprotein Pal [Rhodobacteraceae bacterium]|nr:peptidoglycan-associated lipoprotein Pal [Paracoccaceae bacterium]